MRIEEFWMHRATGPSLKILVGATLAFSQLGYHGASTRQIATKAQMSPAAVYIHFDSKEDLFFTISEAVHLAAFEAMRSPGDLTDAPVERLRLAVAGFATFHAEMNMFVRTVQYELRVLTGERFDRIAAIRADIDSYLRSILQSGLEQEKFLIPDFDGTALLILSFCIDIGRWYREGGHRTPSSIGIQYSDLAVRLVSSLAAAPGPSRK
jgi:AcrR family transcriptional regulator